MNTQIISHLFGEELYRFSAPVVVVLPRNWNAYSDDDQFLLKKIINSVKLDFREVQLVVRNSADLESLKTYSPAQVLVFGSDTVPEIPLYDPVSAQGFTVIRADDLTALDDQKKKSLWLGLRQMFGV